ncbi:MAG: hypothetical protein JRH20_31775 [Deltaproteobacteria bacterium]|nr:hypothetical protein [Deltaproteobacteria bacterium]
MEHLGVICTWYEVAPVAGSQIRAQDMTGNPYEPPKSDVDVPEEKRADAYLTYAEVPVYRRQWFFWLTYFTVPPIALGVLAFGDVFYVKKGKVVSFGWANRIVAGFSGIYYTYRVVSAMTGN